MTPSPADTGVFTALRAFLVAILPSGVPILRGQANRVPEPSQSDFVVMWELRRERIEMNVDSSADVVFTGSISGATMTVSVVVSGTIEIGATVFGVLVLATKILAQTSGLPGQAGTYTVDQPQNVSSRTLSSGATGVTQNTKVIIQCDVHGPNAADNAQTISTLLRDEYGYESFANQSPNYGVVPLYTEDPRQLAFLNDSQQWEDRFMVEVALQVNPTVSVPQQYADIVTIDLINVDATYPPI